MVIVVTLHLRLRIELLVGLRSSSWSLGMKGVGALSRCASRGRMLLRSPLVDRQRGLEITAQKCLIAL